MCELVSAGSAECAHLAIPSSAYVPMLRGRNHCIVMRSASEKPHCDVLQFCSPTSEYVSAKSWRGLNVIADVSDSALSTRRRTTEPACFTSSVVQDYSGRNTYSQVS